MNNDIDKPTSEPPQPDASEIGVPQWALPPALAELWDAGQSEVVLELIQLFLTDTSDRLDLLQRAFAEQDLDKLKRMAHSIKGSCSQMGEDRMAQLGKQLEEMFGNGCTEGSDLLLAALSHQFEASSRAIRAFLENQG